MSKLLDMFAQARRAQGGSGMGFLGKNRQETKPRAAAIVIELATADVSNAEAALKAGADGLLFTWDGKDTSWPETLKSVTEAAQAGNEKAVSGLRITGGWDTLTRERLEQIKEQGIAYIVLPLDAPASLLAQHVKDLDLVVTVPMREGELYPIFIRNLTAFDGRGGCCVYDTCGEICPSGARYSPDYTFKQLVEPKKIVLHDRTLVRRLMLDEKRPIVVAAQGFHHDRPTDPVEYRAKIDFVAEWLGTKRVAELERLGTALYVTLTEASAAQDRAARICELKPHVAPVEAQDAVAELDNMIARAHEQGFIANQVEGGGAQ